MKITEENKHRITILLFLVAFTAATHLIFGLGDFVPPPETNTYPLGLIWIASGIGCIWAARHLSKCRRHRGDALE